MKTKKNPRQTSGKNTGKLTSKKLLKTHDTNAGKKKNKNEK